MKEPIHPLRTTEVKSDLNVAMKNDLDVEMKNDWK